jgi:hypothetical protein
VGFVSQSPETFRLFAAAILPALFVLGLFTTVPSSTALSPARA